MKTSRIGNWFILGGLLLLAAALLLTVGNLWEEMQAAKASSEALRALYYRVQSRESDAKDTPPAPLEQDETVSSPDIPAYLLDPDMEMPVEEIDGQDYIGAVELPALGLSLPVISRWSYPRLKIAPCRYAGSAYRNDLIIMAHNYKSHFGALAELQVGDAVYFTDMDGNVFAYTVLEREVLGDTDVQAMSAGDWDLTLFTCDPSGKVRVTVRCGRTWPEAVPPAPVNGGAGE